MGFRSFWGLAGFTSRFATLVVTGMVLSACAPGLFPSSKSSHPMNDGVSVTPTEGVSQSVFSVKHVPFDRLPGWGAQDLTPFLPAFLRSCAKLSGKPADGVVGPVASFGTVGDWMALCEKMVPLQSQNHNTLRYFLEKNFRPYLVSDNNKTEGLFTGYYEAELQGAWQPGGAFTVPILSRPKDIISADLGDFRAELAGTSVAGRIEKNSFVPFYSREDINAGALQGRQLELMWVNSSVDAFFLHIQGSGRVVMEDGSAVRVGYAGRNGQRYVAVGRELIASNIISQEDMSMQAIRAWMEINPIAAEHLMNTNPSYIFFRIMDELNPVGAQGVALSPGYSLAVDDDFIPYGMPIWLDIADPRDPDHKTPLQRLVVSQDTGSAIRGVVRGDLFWGFGRDAAAAAGVMKEYGNYYVLLPRTAPIGDIDLNATN